MNYNPGTEEIRADIEEKLSRLFGETPAEASREQLYRAVAGTVREILVDKRSKTKEKIVATQSKQVYYICMEYLLGRSLKTNLHNLGLAEKYAAVLKGMGRDLEDLYECEPDAGLGNGGLGRLAACFTDSLASLG